jgi:hypothetical protein
VKRVQPLQVNAGEDAVVVQAVSPFSDWSSVCQTQTIHESNVSVVVGSFHLFHTYARGDVQGSV